jgi:ATP-binding cassette subfamily B protein RaxB
MKLILQSESSECGLACLAMISHHFGYQASLLDLRRQFSVSLKGATLNQLMRHANAIGLSARPLRLSLHELSELRLPCVLHWDLKHFVVLSKVKKSISGRIVYTILDPAVGVRKISLDQISKSFTGVALEFTASEEFEKLEMKPSLSISQLTGKILGLRGAVSQIIALAVALEIFSIVSPLFNQFIIDEVIVSGDQNLLKVLTLGFALLLITQTAIDMARSWFLMRWSIDIGLQWSTRVFKHLIRLPVVYFEKRHLGDIVSRFGSISSMQGTLTTLLVESALDGVMAVLALGMMLIYSPLLTLIVIICVLLYTLLRWISYSPLREASQERLILAAKESSHFLESIRGITPIKLFGREAERTARWSNLMQDVINREIKTQKLGIVFRISSTAISGARGLILFYIGAGMVMSNSLSVGMLTAFASYASTFSSRIFSLVDVLVNVRMLSMHSERLADIVLEEVEPESPVETDLERLEPSVTLKAVKFRYADGEPWVLNGVDLHIPSGQSIALVGPSGCGKTTLCKIILGLLPPTEGEVLVDNLPITQLGVRNYRKIIGTVMQEDLLLTGSIFDNICFFDPQADVTQVETCARLASIHTDIAAMPMGYQTLVGDMGSTLSGGQKQRVLIARALYKKPKILALDEATSHLDIENEKKVNSALAILPLTRVMVAHRPQTIAAAQRVVALISGVAVEVRNATSEARSA